jgi:hypothetical protein
MNFKQATDALLEPITLDHLAKEMGISVQSLRQARASEESTAYRSPPPDWQKAVVRLTEVRIRKLQRLLNQLH